MKWRLGLAGDLIEWLVPNRADESRWDEFVRQSANGCFLHTGRFLNYHGERFDERIALISNGSGDPMAGVRFVMSGEIGTSHPGATFGGILFRSSMRSSEAVNYILSLAQGLRGNGISVLRIRPMPLLLRPHLDESDLYAIARLGGQLVRRELSTILSLRDGLRLGQLRRRQIAKARRTGVTVKEGQPLEPFHRILVDSLSRHGIQPVHRVAELNDLHSRLPENIRLFTAHSQSQDPVAGALIFDFGAVVHTQYLAATEEGRAVGALDLIIHHLGAEVYADRDYLSFGISTEQGGRVLNEGLVNYKESFGGAGQTIDTYEIKL